MSPSDSAPSSGPAGESDAPSGETAAEGSTPGSTGDESTPNPADRPIAEILHGGPVLLFDGVCNLCNGFVQFIVPRDPEGTIRFAPLQSEVGERLAAHSGIDPDAMETLVLIDESGSYTRSDAVLRLAGYLGGIYRVGPPLRYVPRVVRDTVYDLVAANRYRVFGKRDRCMVPDEDVSDRFLVGSGRPGE